MLMTYVGWRLHDVRVRRQCMSQSEILLVSSMTCIHTPLKSEASRRLWSNRQYTRNEDEAGSGPGFVPSKLDTVHIQRIEYTVTFTFTSA